MVLLTSSHYVENVVVMIPFLQVNETSMHAMQLYPPGLICIATDNPAAGTSASKITPWRTELRTGGYLPSAM